MARNKKKTTLRPALQILCAILGVVFAVLLAGTLYAERLLGSMNFEGNGFREQLTLEQAIDFFLEQTEPEDAQPGGSGLTGADVELEKAETLLPQAEHVVNILLIGADYQSGDRARSDSMILCTFDQKKGTITLTSFLRDLYVQIPGYYKNRINASYAIGGMKLLEETLAYNFGLTLDGMVEVDFSGFERVIDLLGGVEMELSRAEADFINVKNGDSLTAGRRKLTGAQALWYSRFRGDSSGDFGRTNRQRTLLTALASGYRDAGVKELLNLAEEILPMITTDMKKREILSLASDLFPMLSRAEIVTQRIPAEGGYYMTRIDGMSVLVPDVEFNIRILEDTVAG